MSRTDQYQIHLTRERDGKDFGIWRTHSGGGVDSNEAFTRDAYGLPRRSLGGPQTVDTISCSRTFYPGSGFPGADNGQVEEMEQDAGNARYICNRQKLDANGFAVGKPQIRRGVLKSIKPSDVDVGEDSPGADDYTIEISPDGI